MKNSILFIGILLVGITSCKPKVTVKDNDGNSIQFEVNDIELTSSDKENKKDNLIINSVNTFLSSNNSSIVKNYWFLCDSVNIRPIRDYDVNHKNENIYNHLGKKTVSIRPVPGSYVIAEGPYAEYKITDDSLGSFHSYVIDINLNDDYQIIDFNATLRFSKIIKGINTVTFKHMIQKDEDYLIEKKIMNKNWW